MELEYPRPEPHVDPVHSTTECSESPTSPSLLAVANMPESYVQEYESTPDKMSMVVRPKIVIHNSMLKWLKHQAPTAFVPQPHSDSVTSDNPAASHAPESPAFSLDDLSPNHKALILAPKALELFARRLLHKAIELEPVRAHEVVEERDCTHSSKDLPTSTPGAYDNAHKAALKVSRNPSWPLSITLSEQQTQLTSDTMDAPTITTSTANVAPFFSNKLQLANFTNNKLVVRPKRHRRRRPRQSRPMTPAIPLNQEEVIETVQATPMQSFWDQMPVYQTTSSMDHAPTLASVWIPIYHGPILLGWSLQTIVSRPFEQDVQPEYFREQDNISEPEDYSPPEDYPQSQDLPQPEDFPQPEYTGVFQNSRSTEHKRIASEYSTASWASANSGESSDYASARSEITLVDNHDSIAASRFSNTMNTCAPQGSDSTLLATMMAKINKEAPNDIDNKEIQIEAAPLIFPVRSTTIDPSAASDPPKESIEAAQASSKVNLMDHPTTTTDDAFKMLIDLAQSSNKRNPADHPSPADAFKMLVDAARPTANTDRANELVETTEASSKVNITDSKSNFQLTMVQVDEASTPKPDESLEEVAAQQLPASEPSSPTTQLSSSQKEDPFNDAVDSVSVSRWILKLF